MRNAWKYKTIVFQFYEYQQQMGNMPKCENTNRKIEATERDGALKCQWLAKWSLMKTSIQNIIQQRPILKTIQRSIHQVALHEHFKQNQV